MSLGAIEAEIQQFEYRPVSRNRPFLVKFTDPYLGHRLTQKSKILVLKVFHGGLSPYQISTKSVMMTSIFFLKCVDLTWNAPINSDYYPIVILFFCRLFFLINFIQGRIKTSGGPKPRAGLRHPGALTTNMGVRRGREHLRPRILQIFKKITYHLGF